MSKNVVNWKMTKHNADCGIFCSFFDFSDTVSATKLIIQTDHTNVKHKRSNLTFSYANMATAAFAGACSFVKRGRIDFFPGFRGSWIPLPI